MQHYQLHQEKIKYLIVLIGTIFLLTINMCDRGRTITHLQISRFHTQVWYNSWAPLLSWFNFNSSMEKNNHMSSKKCYKINDSFPNFKCAKFGNGFHPTLHNWCNHLSILGLKLDHANQLSSWWACIYDISWRTELSHGNGTVSDWNLDLSVLKTSIHFSFHRNSQPMFLDLYWWHAKILHSNI